MSAHRPVKVAAVVVTWNRCELLAETLDALRSQRRLPDSVIVVDNASDDGTAEVLAQQTDLDVVTLPANLGGAGGFSAGLRRAVGEHAADVVWLMDDDGVPAAGCLEALEPHMLTHDFVGPAVLAKDDPDRLCFPIRLPGTATVVHDMTALRGAATDAVLEEVVIPFNGVLLTRELVERIGLPREEFFIWGDDVEYLWRARRAGARVATVVDAHLLHPATDDLGSAMAWGRTTYNHTPSDLKHYCMCRNNVVNLREYVGILGVLAFVAKTLWFYTFTRPSPARLRLSVGAMAAGLRSDFTGHRRFLR
jgi:rhamnopyranosyl-N-acetylglucosaminyl-diphospho-decaprenol beta-1,3/1,4-galactofuranosyltransferase